LQIQESGNYGVMRLAVTEESYGWSSGDVIYVEYQNHTVAVKDDVVTVYGQLSGSKTYESQARFNITVPSMFACAVEKDTVGAQTSTSKEILPQQATTDQSTQQSAAPDASAAKSTATVSQTNAVRKAKSYLSYSAFSHDGLVAQLEHEQFPHADAVYGVDNSGANWDEQAAKKAESYMEYSAYSRGGLIKQLVFEKFTQEQAEYGADAVGL